MFTPGDFPTLAVLLLAPMVALYEGGILLSSMVRRERLEIPSILAPILYLYEVRRHWIASRSGAMLQHR